MTKTNNRHVAVLLFDPNLPYSFAKGETIGEQDLRAAERLREALSSLDGYRFTYFDDHEVLVDRLRETPVDLALNFCDVGYRNDWNRIVHIVTLLEVFGIPYTGSDAPAMILASDKAAARAMAVGAGVPVPEETYIDLAQDPISLPERYPSLIKPCIGGGSFGVTKESLVHDDAEARQHLGNLAKSGNPPLVIAQEFLPGTEYTIGLLGNPDGEFEMLPPVEIDFSGLDEALPRIFTYDAKFDSESPYYHALQHRQAELSDEDRADLEQYCQRLVRRLGIRDYARIDFRRDGEGQLKFIDANPNPTWHYDSRLATAAGWAGYDYPELIDKILHSAQKRVVDGDSSR